MQLHFKQLGQGEPLVLLHGLFGHSDNWFGVAPKLAEKFHVFMPDLRNHGHSPHHPEMDYPLMAADVEKFFAAQKIESAHVIGHSMGGKVAMRTALLHPDAVERLLVADIAPVVYPPHNHPIVAAMQAIPLHDGLTRAAADTALAAAVPSAAVRAFLLQNLRLGMPPIWRIGLDEIAAALADLEGWDGPTAATAPDAVYAGRTLFVAGETSDYITRDDRPLIRALFPAARFVTVKHAGHWLHADNPAGFLAVVEAFLSAPPPR